MVILLPDRVFKLRKMLPDRVKITAPQRHTPVDIRSKCPPPQENRVLIANENGSLRLKTVRVIAFLPYLHSSVLLLIGSMKVCRH